MKRCAKCGASKSADAFTPKRAVCRDCRAREAVEYRQRNCADVRERDRARHRRDRASESVRAQRAAEARAAYARQPERECARVRQYQKAHYDVRTRIAATRRARKLNAFIEVVDPGVLYRRDRGRCGVCGDRVTRRDASIDHIVALSRGGLHTYDNVQLAHRRCNSSKGTRTLGQLRIPLSSLPFTAQEFRNGITAQETAGAITR